MHKSWENYSQIECDHRISYLTIFIGVIKTRYNLKTNVLKMWDGKYKYICKVYHA